MAREFEDHVVWITGASSGIGREMAIEFARQGASLALSARRTDRIEALAADLRKAGGRAIAVSCDVTQESSVAAAVSEIIAEFSRLDVAVANAGFGVSGLLGEIEISDWRRQMDTNFIGTITTAHYALPHLRQTKGRLVFVGSVSAMLSFPRGGPYAASKYAVRAVAQTLFGELAGSGVTCTILHPGYVASEIGQVDNQGVHHGDRKDGRPSALMWPTDRAARVMVRAIFKRKREYTFTVHGKFAAFMGRHAASLLAFVFSRRGSGRR